MPTNPVISLDGKVALTTNELDALQDLLDRHDRGGFYMAYNAMTDNDEATLQAKISTFSGPTGGVAYGANRIGQTWLEGSTNPAYPGIYFQSQKVAEAALAAISDHLDDEGGLITDELFFQSADNAWQGNLHDYFPGNLLTGTENLFTALGSLLYDAVDALIAIPMESATENDFLAVMDDALEDAKEALDTLATPGSFAAMLAILVHSSFGKDNGQFTAFNDAHVNDAEDFKYVAVSNGYGIWLNPDGHVAGVDGPDLNDYGIIFLDAAADFATGLVSPDLYSAVTTRIRDMIWPSGCSTPRSPEWNQPPLKASAEARGFFR